MGTVGTIDAANHHAGNAWLPSAGRLAVITGWTLAALAIALRRWAPHLETAWQGLDASSDALQNGNNGHNHFARSVDGSGSTLEGAARRDALGALVPASTPAVMQPTSSGTPLKVPIWWHAPFLSGGGYASEAVAFALALDASPAVSAGGLHIVQHGDGVSNSGLLRMHLATMSTIMRLMHNREQPAEAAVMVCHSVPTAWRLPEPLWHTPPCPPADGPPSTYTVGRTMFETDNLDLEWVRRCNLMDEIWVPTQFHEGVFREAGVTTRMMVIPEPVDVRFFDPAAVIPLPLPLGRLVFGQPRPPQQPTFHFLSIFKWEERKGWRLLLEAYLRQFSGDARREGRRPVTLTILTHPFHSSNNFADKMHTWAADALGLLGQPNARGLLPAVYVMTGHLSDDELRRLYKAADVFVLPSRGEGWGRPHVEAMAMGLPVIATNWSGPTAFMTEHNSYPLPIDGLEPATGMHGHQWASPSLSALRSLMAQVASNPTEARERGRVAREDMMRMYAPPVVARQVVDRLRAIETIMSGRSTQHPVLA